MKTTSKQSSKLIRAARKALKLKGNTDVDVALEPYVAELKKYIPKASISCERNAQWAIVWHEKGGALTSVPFEAGDLVLSPEAFIKKNLLDRAA